MERYTARMAQKGVSTTFMMQRGRFSAVGLLLSAIALLFAAAVPNGYMPSIGKNGITVVICTTDGLAELVLGPDGEPLDQPETALERCHWASAAKAFTLPPQAPGSSISSLLGHPAPVRIGDFRLPTVFAGRFDARAPPALL